MIFTYLQVCATYVGMIHAASESLKLEQNYGTVSVFHTDMK